MSSQIVPIHRTDASNTSNKNDVWFNAYDHAPGQDANIRWLSRPNQQLVQEKYNRDSEKFRITFDVENFKPEQIKIYIQNRKLTISGVYEEHSEGRDMQKQFERTFDLPANADVDSMASFITANHMLVVEILLHPAGHVDHLNVNSNANDQRRVSFSLNKFNTENNQGLLSTSNDSTGLSTPGQQVRRTSMTKTTTTTTTTGSSALPSEATELLRNADTTTGGSNSTYTTHSTERRLSNTGNQLISYTEPSTSSSTNKQTTLTTSELANLPIDIPPELLASGGTITIQKRKVSVTRGTDGTTDHTSSVPITHSNNTESLSSTTTTKSTTQNTDEAVSVPITRTNNTQSTSSTTTNTTQQQPASTTESLGSKTISSSNSSHLYTLEEFLQNKTWNPSIVDGPGGKKILHMRLQMKPGATSDQIKISLNGHDLRVEYDNKPSNQGGRNMSEHSYRQVTLFPTCDASQLKTEFRDDGFLHIQVPIEL